MSASIYKSLVARLAEYAPTAARFGDDVSTSRVFAQRAPTGTAYPYVVIHSVTNSDEAVHMTGTGNLYKPTIQVDVFGDDLDVTLDAANEVRDALRSWAGAYAGLHIIRAFKDADFDDNEEPQNAGEDLRFRVVIRWEVWYKTI